MDTLGFSWLREGEVAGHSCPLSVDHLLFLKKKGIKALVRMAEADMAGITSAQVADAGLIDFHEPVEDFHTPSREQIDRIIAFMTSSVAQGEAVGVSCRAGRGRTGTILACYLISLGYSASEAISKVRAKRPGSVETEAQERSVRLYYHSHA